MLVREQRCLTLESKVLRLATVETAQPSQADPPVALLHEELFVDQGSYCKRSLANMLSAAGLDRCPNGRGERRREIWNALLAHVEETPTMVAHHKKRPNDAERPLPEPDATPRRQNKRTPMDCTIHLTATKPRRKKGAALKRFNLYHDGMTVKEYCDAGGIPWDVWYDTLYGYVELRNPDGTPFQREGHVA